MSTTPFVDRSGGHAPSADLWPAYLIPAEVIDVEIGRLGDLPAPANGRRQSFIVHPNASEPGLGLAPGIRVTLEVLLPGEHTDVIRHNSSQVNFCIRGAGHALVNDRRIDYAQYDVWATPSMAIYSHHNATQEPQVRLTYSNAPLLEKLNVHFVDEDPDVDPPAIETNGEIQRGVDPDLAQNPFADILRLTDDHGESAADAYLTSYEKLINPEVIEQKPLHWPWRAVKHELDKLAALGADYKGRRLYLLYNPATGRTMGTTNNFFATMCIRPAGIVDRPHRHTSAAINYFFSGRGNSIVGGKRYEWKSGDLMLTAPGWMIHRHASGDEPVYELTIQDSPLHLSMDSLLWQEDLRNPFHLLGSHAGFETNKATDVLE